MSNNPGIKKTHELMKNRLIEYITSQYFGDKGILINSSKELLDTEGAIYKIHILKQMLLIARPQMG